MPDQIVSTAITAQAVIGHGILASFGALAHSINAHRKGQSKNLTDFFLLTIMSSFSGLIFALLALYYFDNQYITLAAAGSGGFLGVEGLTIIASKIRDILVSNSK